MYVLDCTKLGSRPLKAHFEGSTISVWLNKFWSIFGHPYPWASTTLGLVRWVLAMLLMGVASSGGSNARTTLVELRLLPLQEALFDIEVEMESITSVEVEMALDGVGE